VTDVEAHITGTVWKIECEVGDEIEEGDTVAILESMKMEMPVETEDAGTVAEINEDAGTPRPAGLVAGPEARVIVPVKILVEQHEVAPVRVGLESRR